MSFPCPAYRVLVYAFGAPWTQRTSSFDTSDIEGIAYGNGVWVATGASGKLATATDPTATWTQRTSSFGGSFIEAVAYGGGVWVAVGSAGKLATATDPTGTWTQRTSSFGTTSIDAVAYGNGVWVAVGANGKLATATDPTSTWTQRTSSFGTDQIWGVAYGGTTWVAVGGGGKLATAADPTATWTQRTSSFGTDPIIGVAYGNGVWVAGGNAGKLATATDPTATWTQRASSFETANSITSVAYGNGAWVAVGDSGKLATATDPAGTWTQQTSSFGITYIYGVAYGNGAWVAVAHDGKLATTTGPFHGPARLLAEFAHAKNIGYADTLNDVPDAFFTIDQDDPQLPQVIGYEGRAHVRILRDDAVVWAGWFGMEHSSNERDVIFTCYGYLAGLYFLPSAWNTQYTNTQIGTIVSDGWTRAKTGITDSPLGFVTTGTVEAPVTTSGGATPITLPKYSMFYKRTLFMLREMAAISISDTTNTVVFEITHSNTPTFNFWKNRGVNRPDVVWAYGDTIVSGFLDYQMPVDQRTSILGVGSAPANALLRYEWAAPAGDVAAYGARQEPVYFQWVRDALELQRATALRGATARQVSPDVTIKFSPNSVVPPGGTGAGFKMSDTVRVRINRGATQLDTPRLVTGFRVLVLGGNEFLRVLTRPALGG